MTKIQNTVVSTKNTPITNQNGFDAIVTNGTLVAQVKRTKDYNKDRIDETATIKVYKNNDNSYSILEDWVGLNGQSGTKLTNVTPETNGDWKYTLSMSSNNNSNEISQNELVYSLPNTKNIVYPDIANINSGDDYLDLFELYFDPVTDKFIDAKLYMGTEDTKNAIQQDGTELGQYAILRSSKKGYEVQFPSIGIEDSIRSIPLSRMAERYDESKK